MGIEMKKLLIMTGVALSLSSAGHAQENKCPIASDVASKMNIENKATSHAQKFIQDALSDVTMSDKPRATINFPTLTLTQKPIGNYILCKYTADNDFSLSFYINAKKEEKNR